MKGETPRRIEIEGRVEYRLSNGWAHRDDGPALIFADGTKHWCQYGSDHREDGPAIEFSDGSYMYKLRGKEVRKEEVESLAQANRAERIASGLAAIVLETPEKVSF